MTIKKKIEYNILYKISITRRNRPLAGIAAQYDDYNLVFQVEIYRIVLLVNGIESPVILFTK